ncbi:hypothetical protein T35B1_17816 [Salinisphaera shabanensis T35B1]|uniref:hypothetical protein n=1 Tax=Salinisphaera shabanensis TaxID=180542 RepID=UPI0002123CBE
MATNKLDQHWDELCEEWNEANERFLASFERVNKHFMAAANDASASNAASSELDEQAAAWKQLEDIKLRMSNFVERNS